MFKIYTVASLFFLFVCFFKWKLLSHKLENITYVISQFVRQISDVYLCICVTAFIKVNLCQQNCTGTRASTVHSFIGFTLFCQEYIAMLCRSKAVLQTKQYGYLRKDLRLG